MFGFPFNRREVIIGIALLSWFTILWTSLFRWQLLPIVWTLMLAAVSLCAAAWLGNEKGSFGIMKPHRLLLLGIGSGFLLYCLFFLGHRVLHTFFPHAFYHLEVISSIQRKVTSPVGAAMIFSLMAVGEELFWRGFLQARLMKKLGRYPGWHAAVLLYALIHIPANNPILFLAAVFAGIFWGWLYLRTRTVWVGVTSHVVWTLLVTIILPFPESSGDRFVQVIRTICII